MNLSLKQAHRLSDEVNQLITKTFSKLPVGYRAATNVSIFEYISERVLESQNLVNVVYEEGVLLISARYTLRKMIASGKHLSGINDLLTQEQEINERFGRIKQILDLPVLEAAALKVATLSLDKLRLKEDATQDHVILSGILSKDQSETFSTLQRLTKKQLVDIKDAISILNNTTTITLDSDMLDIFNKFNLL